MARKDDKTSLLDHENLKTFKQHGFEPEEESGKDQVTGACPFCGDDHFFVNPKTKGWDCKHCVKEGGFQRFLVEMQKACEKAFTGRPALKLANDRGLQLTTMKSFGVGYNPNNGKYVIPVWDEKREKLLDLRIYNGKRVVSTFGCKAGLWGVDTIAEVKEVWLCEGEWDRMAMREMLSKSGKGGGTASVPGAGTFKSEWFVVFRDKTVNTMYDNDDPGRAGALKVYKGLRGPARSLRFVHWPRNYPDGFDLRDYYHKIGRPKPAMSGLEAFLRELPQDADGGMTTGDDSVQVEWTDEQVDCGKVYKAYRKWLHMKDTEMVDVMYGSLIANRMQGDPLWLFYVGDSGSGKTEMLMSIMDGANIVSTTGLTPHSLVSGANFAGADPSLIPKLDEKVLVVKDFTAILQMNPLARDEIFSILRDAYDGKTEKAFGNGKFASYEARFGIMAGVTRAIEAYIESSTALGERFLSYLLPISDRPRDRIDMMRRARANVGREVQMREELAAMGKKVLQYRYEDIPTVPKEIDELLFHLSQFTAMMRATVIRDRLSKEVLYLPFSEVGTRLVKQLTKEMLGVAQFKGKDRVTMDEYAVARKLGRASIPSRLERIVKGMWDGGQDREFSHRDVYDMSGLPSMTAGKLVENLCLMGMMVRKKLSGIKANYRLSDDCLDMIEGGDVYA